jgi:membrane protein
VVQPAQELPPFAERVVQQAERDFGSAQVPLARRLRFFDIVRAVARAAGPHHLPAFAGNLAYNAFLAIVPFLLFLLSVLRALHATDLLSSLVDVLSASLPAASAQIVRDQVQAEVASRLPDMWLLSGLLAVGALWASSAVFRAVAAAMNVMYEAREDRSLLAQLALSIGLSLASAVLVLVAFGVVQILAQPLAALSGAAFGGIWTVVQWALLIGIAWAAFAATYLFTPCVKRPIRAITPGAALATLAAVLFSFGFAFVVNVFGAILVDPLYGWFTGVFALLLYLYWISFIVLLGAEVNHVIEVHGGRAV